MSDAPNYTPTTSFAEDESNSASGRSTVKTESLDTELANVSSSINALNVNLQLLQRDDGKIRDGIVEPYQLSEQTRALLATGGSPKGNWTINTPYYIGDAVQYSSIVYLCVVAHQSGSSFNAGLWMAISGDGSSFASAEASALSASQALSYRNSALTYATNAQNSANSSSASSSQSQSYATDAQNSAIAAELARLSAESMISNAIDGADQAEAEAGVDNSKFMSSLRVKQSIDANTPEKATTVEAEAGADDDHFMTALKTKQAIDALAIGGFSNMMVITASDPAWVIPAETIKVTVVGGGGAGSNGIANAISNGGSAGGTAIKIITGLTIGDTVALTVGGSTQTSSFGAHCSATGGVSGSGTINNRQIGGIGIGGDINIRGGSPESNNQGSQGLTGGASYLAQGGCGSPYANNTSIAGYSGQYGSGGGGGGYNGASFAGGAGGAGVIIVEY
jgi:hypothetical protein